MYNHQETKNHYRRFIAILLSLIVVLGGGYLIYNALVFRLTGTNPGVNDVATTAPFFKIKFNKALISSSVRLEGDPRLIASYKTTGKTLDIIFNQPLKNGARYRIVLKSITSGDNKVITNQTFNFTARFIAYNNLPKDQQQALIAQQQQYNQLTGTGLPKLLPFTAGGLQFRVSYTVQYQQGTPAIKLVITAPTQSGQQAALNWIRSLGYDPSKYTVTYVTAPVGS